MISTPEPACPGEGLWRTCSPGWTAAASDASRTWFSGLPGRLRSHETNSRIDARRGHRDLRGRDLAGAPVALPASAAAAMDGGARAARGRAGGSVDGPRPPGPDRRTAWPEARRAALRVADGGAGQGQFAGGGDNRRRRGGFRHLPERFADR